MSIDEKMLEIEYRVAAWSVGFRWLTFDYSLPTMGGSPLLTPLTRGEYLETVECPSAEAWLLEHQESHMARHAAALRHGLSPGGSNDLTCARVMIDRTLRDMLRHDGIDVLPIVEALGTDSDYLGHLASGGDYASGNFFDRRFLLRQEGSDLPVLAAWLPLGRAKYCGHALDLATELPHTICAGSAGRRLGDLVATGNAGLDNRRISHVLTLPFNINDHIPLEAKTRIVLAPALVAIGS